MSRRIEILVHPDGRTEVRTVGFSGAACKEASQVIEKALGTITQEQMTPEFYSSTKIQNPQHEGLSS